AMEVTNDQNCRSCRSPARLAAAAIAGQAPARLRIWGGLLRDLLRNVSVRVRLGGRLLRAQPARRGAGGPLLAVAADQRRAADHLCGAAQRDGAAGVQAVVHEVRAAPAGTEHLRAAVEPGADSAVLAVAASGR